MRTSFLYGKDSGWHTLSSDDSVKCTSLLVFDSSYTEFLQGLLLLLLSNEYSANIDTLMVVEFR